MDTEATYAPAGTPVRLPGFLFPFPAAPALSPEAGNLPSREMPVFREDRRKADPSSTPRSDERPDQEAAAEKGILCRQCREIVTRQKERIFVQGGHQHTFANPHGIVFEIGLFRSAQGCAAVGDPTSEFTWFSGYRWRLALCSRCLVHLGWLFVSAGADRFFGLILDRLLFSE